MWENNREDIGEVTTFFDLEIFFERHRKVHIDILQGNLNKKSFEMINVWVNSNWCVNVLLIFDYFGKEFYKRAINVIIQKKCIVEFMKI